MPAPIALDARPAANLLPLGRHPLPPTLANSNAAPHAHPNPTKPPVAPNIHPRITIAPKMVLSDSMDSPSASASSLDIPGEPRRRHREIHDLDPERGLGRYAPPKSRGSSPARSLPRPRPSSASKERPLDAGVFASAKRYLNALFDSGSETEPGTAPRYRPPAQGSRRSKSPPGSATATRRGRATASVAAGTKVGYDPATGALYVSKRSDLSLPSMRTLMVGSLVCSATFLGAEIIRQVFLERLSVLSLHWSRILTMTLFGLLFKGPSLVVFYRALDHWFPGKDPAALAKKMAIDLGPWAWLQNGAFLWYAAVMDGAPMVHALLNAAHALLPLQLAAYKVWIPAHLVNHKLIPTKFKVLYVNCIGLLWSVALCALSGQVAVA